MDGERDLRRVSPAIRQRARELRRPPTPTEQRLWTALRSRRAIGLKFRRQHPIGRFIADFCCPEHHLIVELDGDSHATRVDYDVARTEYLESRGYQVIRFANGEVAANLDGVLSAIVMACGFRVDLEAGSPLPERERGQG